MAETNPAAGPGPINYTLEGQMPATGTDLLRRNMARQQAFDERQTATPGAPDDQVPSETVVDRQTSAPKYDVQHELPFGPGTADEHMQAARINAGQAAAPEAPSDPEPSTPKTYVQDELDLGIPKLGEQPSNANRLSTRLANGLDRISGLLRRVENRRTPRQFIGDKVESAKQSHKEASKTAWYVGSAGVMGASVKRERVSTKREKPTVQEAGETAVTAETIASTRELFSVQAKQAREHTSERLTKGLNTTKKIGRMAVLGTGLTLALPVVAAVEGTKFVNRKTRAIAEDITTGVKNTYHQAHVDASEEKKRGAIARADATEKAWNDREAALKEKHLAAETKLTENASAEPQSAAERRSIVEAEAIKARQQSRINLLKAQQQLELNELAVKRASKVVPQRLRAKGYHDSAAAHREKISTKPDTKASTTTAA